MAGMLSLPLYRNDGKASIKLSTSQQKTIESVKEKIAQHRYILQDNPCLCKNIHNKPDMTVSEKDRYGFPISTIICGSCGLVRCGKVFDKSSLAYFYENDYRSIYTLPNNSPKTLFENQTIKGKGFFDFLCQHIDLSEKITIYDIGCGAGGVMYPFHLNGHECVGFDYNPEYIAYGNSKGLKISQGECHAHVKEQSADLIILSHVLEHFIDPIQEIQQIIRILKPSGHLLIEVPGLMGIKLGKRDPILYLQNAHIYSFYQSYLEVFFNAMNLSIIHGDETSLFLLKKPNNWHESTISTIYDDSLNAYPDVIKKVFLNGYFRYRFFLSKNRWINTAISFMEMAGIKNIVKKIIKR